VASVDAASRDSLPEFLAARGRSRLAVLVGVIMSLDLMSLTFETVGLIWLDFNPICSGVSFLAHGLNLIAGVLLFRAARNDEITTRRLIRLGLTYQVLVCFSFSVAEQVGLHYGAFEVGGLSALVILLLLFPLFVPATRRQTLIASFTGATMAPVAVVVYGVALDSDLPDLFAASGFAMVMNYLVAGLAVLPQLVVRDLGKGAREARRLGAYRLEALVGRGAMGEVWRGAHRFLRRPAAVKLIRPDRASDGAESALRRFEREAQATANLCSPHSCIVFDFGVSSDGAFYYVMELLDGFDLKTLVERFGPLPAERVVHLLAQACDALGEAHSVGLIHRDVKPANLFTCRYGLDLDFTKVLDFGLVKSVQGGTDVTDTGIGAIAGTPAFMAPEAITDPSLMGPAADIYALGCVAFWLLTGRVVFEGATTMKVLLAHVNEPPVAPSTLAELPVPPALDALVLQCLAKDPAERPPSAAALRAALTAACDTPWTPERAQRWWTTHAAT
jgi:eukaryotic-like serine/threonine-protein kinase